MKTEFMELATARYSVRRFENKAVEPETVQEILQAGHVAPTGCNRQPQRILVINEEGSLSKLRACTKCHFNAPLVFMVGFDTADCWVRGYDGKSCGRDDACIVATHMMLQAADLGVGSTWVMHFDPAALREAFAIPEQIEPVALLVMGYPAADAVPAPAHSEFRPMEETVFFNKL
ncbi:MAG: nitroreductase family protein [Clostridia bacterium]|nr:nitroreductase family protein [Clostridia bacterium]